MAQSLLEKFISSAVRQVGKDTGKVISNGLYGDAHATPVRHIKSEPPKSSLPKPKTVKEILEEQRNGTYKPYKYTPPPTPLYTRQEEKTTESSEWKGFGCFLVVVFIVVFVIVALCNYL